MDFQKQLCYVDFVCVFMCMHMCVCACLHVGYDMEVDSLLPICRFLGLNFDYQT